LEKALKKTSHRRSKLTTPLETFKMASVKAIF